MYLLLFMTRKTNLDDLCMKFFIIIVIVPIILCMFICVMYFVGIHNYLVFYKLFAKLKFLNIVIAT